MEGNILTSVHKYFDGAKSHHWGIQCLMEHLYNFFQMQELSCSFSVWMLSDHLEDESLAAISWDLIIINNIKDDKMPYYLNLKYGKYNNDQYLMQLCTIKWSGD